jgi:hypothetical protein
MDEATNQGSNFGTVKISATNEINEFLEILNPATNTAKPTHLVSSCGMQ